MGYKQTYRKSVLSCYTQSNDGSVTYPMDYQCSPSWLDYRIGHDDPKYKEKIRQGASATNYMYAEKRSVQELQPGFISMLDYNGNHPGAVFSSTWCGLGAVAVGIPYIDPAVLADVRNRAAIRIRQKIRETLQSFSGLTFLGELRETVQMIRRPALGMERALRQFIKSANPRGYRGPKKRYRAHLADQWLELSFGWTPLANDVNRIATAALQGLDCNDIKRVRAVESWDVDSHTQGYNNDLELRVYNGTVTVVGLDVTYIAGVRRNITAESGTPLERIVSSGFHLDDIVPTAWELLPWSFFVDYFSNIGDVISANYLSMSDVAWSQETIRTRCVETKYSAGYLLHAPRVYRVLANNSRVIQAKSCAVRRSSANIPYGEVRVELPSKKFQFANLLALLVSARN